MNSEQRGPGRPRREGVRRAVLDAAVRLVGAQGYRATSLDQIARGAGVAKTTVYRRWDSKGALVADALLERLGILPAVGDAVDLRATVAWLADAAGAPDVHALLIGLLADGDEVREHLRERVRRPFVEQIVEVWQVDAEAAAIAFDLVVGTMVYRSAGSDPLGTRLVDDLTELVVGYLSGSR